ncbi:MAG: DUF2750 domain-containing protein [Bacteroidota bacterium]
MEHLNADQVLALSPKEQYLYFVHKVVASKEVWGLYDEAREGWAMTKNEAGQERLPLWPTVNFAEECRKDRWQATSPLPMDVEIFVRETLDELIDQQRGLSIFYLEGQGGLDIEPEQLRKDLVTLLRHREG